MDDLSHGNLGRLGGGLCLLLSLLGCGNAQAWQTQATFPQAGSNHIPVIVAMGLVDVEQGVARLSVEMPGRIIRIDAKENQTYEKGDILLAVDDTQQLLKLKQATLALKVAEGKVEQAKAGRQIAEAEKRAQIVAIEVAEGREQSYKRRQTDVKGLEIPKSTLRDLEDATRESSMMVKTEKEKLLVVESKLQYALTDETQAQLQMQVVQELVHEAEKAVADCVLKAPFKGKVLRVRARLGELVAPTLPEPLIEYCPDSPRIIRAEIAQEFAQAAKVGQVCKITDDSHNNTGSWTGHIQRMSDWYSPRRSNLFEPLQMNDVRTLECIVSVDPGGEPLRIGQRVRISIETSPTSAKMNELKGGAETRKK